MDLITPSFRVSLIMIVLRIASAWLWREIIVNVIDKFRHWLAVLILQPIRFLFCGRKLLKFAMSEHSVYHLNFSIGIDSRA